MTTSTVTFPENISQNKFNPGDLYIAKYSDNTYFIVMVSNQPSRPNDPDSFSGVVVADLNSNWPIGESSNEWYKSAFERFTGEINLKG